MSSLYQPRPVLSSQRYSPATTPTEYVDAHRNSMQQGGRVPLRESTGNAQAHNLNAQAHNLNSMVSCYQQSPVGISPSMQPPQHQPPPQQHHHQHHQQQTPTIQPPMVPSQSFDCLYRVPTPRQQPRYQRKPRTDVNPLYFWPAFRQYRNRQAHKDTQKDKGGVWRRPELEDAFVDCK